MSIENLIDLSDVRLIVCSDWLARRAGQLLGIMKLTTCDSRRNVLLCSD